MLINNNGKFEVDIDKLKYTIQMGVRFLDDVLDVSLYPIPEIKEMAHKYRKIGLGVMGWAHMLYLLEIPYNSQKAVDLADYIMGFINEESHRVSIDLAKTRGSFPGIDNTIFKGFCVRNATTTTVPPTGSLSIIASISAGIEPEFALAYIKNSAEEELSYVNTIFDEAYRKQTGYNKGDKEYQEVMKEVAKAGTLYKIPFIIPEDIKKVFVTAHDVEVEWHIKMQAVFQKHTDSAVSKTINMSHDATVEDVNEAYLLARKYGCKGTTIYRDGSRENQTLMIGSKKEETKVENNDINKDDIALPRLRPDTTEGFTKKVKIGCGNLYVTVNKDEKGICEVFTNTGRAGGCPSQSEATARLISIALRSGISVPEIIEQLKGIRCPSTVRQKGLSVTSCPDAIGKFLEQIYNNNPIESESSVKIVENTNNKKEFICPKDIKTCAECEHLTECPSTQMEESVQEKYRVIDDSKFTITCPECERIVEHEGGCVICRHCGWGKCG